MESEASGSNKKWYQNNPLLIVALIGFWPASLVALFAAAAIWGKPVQDTKEPPKPATQQQAAPRPRQEAPKIAETKAEAKPTTPQPAPAQAPAPAPSSPGTAATSSSTAAGISDYGGDKDCKDFATQAQAQAYFKSKGGSPTNNVDRLDRDHDGIACEAN